MANSGSMPDHRKMGWCALPVNLKLRIKTKGTMKIEINYNGAIAVCRIEPMEEPGKMVNFNEADTKSQTYALSAFQTIKEHWQREQRMARFKNLPVIHVKRQIEVLPDSIPVLQQLLKEGVVINLQYEISTTIRQRLRSL